MTIKHNLLVLIILTVVMNLRMKITANVKKLKNFASTLDWISVSMRDRNQAIEMLIDDTKQC